MQFLSVLEAEKHSHASNNFTTVASRSDSLPVAQGEHSPTAVFVGVSSLAMLSAAAEAISAEPKTSVRVEYMDALIPLVDVLSKSVSDFTSSGIQERKIRYNHFSL